MSPPSRITTARSLRLILRPQTCRFHAADKVHGLLRSRTSFSQNVSPLYRFQSRRNSQKQLFWDFYARTRKSPMTHENPEPAVRLYAATFFSSLYIYTEKQHICILDISLAIRNASQPNDRFQLTEYLHDKTQTGTVLQRGFSLATVGCVQDTPAPIGSSEVSI